MALAAPEATYTEDLYRFCWPRLGIEAVVENFIDRKEDIACELTVNSSHELAGGRLYSGRLLLLGPNSRRDVRRELEMRIPDDPDAGLDWQGVLEQICNLARERFRRGAPLVDLACVAHEQRPRYLVKPLVMDGAVTILYGDGGTAKSSLALALCLAVATGESVMGLQAERLGSCLYLDWEDDEAVHAERLAALCRGLDLAPPSGLIFYQHRHARLAETVKEARRAVAERGAVMGVVDSLGLAAGDPNNSDLMIECLRACRSLGVPMIGVHHLPKDAKDKTKPYGSVYASNEARLTWLVEKAQEEERSELSLLLTNHKNNRGRREPRLAYRVRYENDDYDVVQRLTIEPSRVIDLEGFEDRVPLWQHMKRLLSGKAATPEEMLVMLEEAGAEVKGGVQVVRNMFNRHREHFAKSAFDSRWAVKADREEPA